MPSSISSGLLSHIQSDTTSLCIICKVTRTDGAIMGFTNHQRDLVVGGVTYRCGSGVTPSAISTTSGTEVDNAEFQWVFAEDQVSERDIVGGLFDDATIEFSIVNYSNLSQGTLKGPKGSAGQVRTNDDGTCVVEFRSLMQRVTMEIGDLTSETCRCIALGDALCKYNLNGNTLDGYPSKAVGMVTTSFGKRSFNSNINFSAQTPAQVAGNYTWQTFTFDTNVGESGDSYTGPAPVSSYNGSRVNLVINDNIKKDLKIGMTGTLTGNHNSTNATNNVSITMKSVRHEADGSWSFQAQGTALLSTPPAANTFPADYFVNGVITWLSGENTGVSSEIFLQDGATLNLNEPMPFPIGAGDSFSIIVGCDRTLEMCKSRFGNTINFRGEPYIKPYERVVDLDDSP